MNSFKTVNEVRRALDKYLGVHGNSHDGAHYLRPDGSRGPVVRYLPWFVELLFAVERRQGSWVISKAWSAEKPLTSDQLWRFQVLVEAAE